MKNSASDGKKPEPQDSPITLLPGDRNDGRVEVVFSADNLELRADFFPSSGSGRLLNTNDIGGALARNNVVHGILWEDIQSAVTGCNLEHRIIRDITIARGDPPVNEVLEYFQFNPALRYSGYQGSGDGQADYRAVSPFVIVKKGQALAKLKSRKPGRDGKDIYGTSIPHGTVRPEGVSPGANTRNDGAFIYADINGQLLEEKGVLNVQDSLVIKGPVDYHTGHIVFPGDVFIEGPVSDGFKIYSGGSVTIKQTFDVTEVVTKGDLAVAGGIIGRGRGLIKAGGEIKTKFIENCKAACRKTVTVDADIVNSSIYTLGKLEMGDKGTILGSEIYAVHGVRTGSIGKKTGKAAVIHCGIDFTAQQEKEKYNHQLKIIAAKLQRIRELLAVENADGSEGGSGTGGSAEVRKKMEDALSRLEEEQKKLTAAAAAVLSRLNADENAAVEVAGEIIPGVLIEICQVALFVSESLHHVRIRLDRGLGRLVTEPLDH